MADTRQRLTHTVGVCQTTVKVLWVKVLSKSNPFSIYAARKKQVYRTSLFKGDVGSGELLRKVYRFA